MTSSLLESEYTQSRSGAIAVHNFQAFLVIGDAEYRQDVFSEKIVVAKESAMDRSDTKIKRPQRPQQGHEAYSQVAPEPVAQVH